VKLAIFGSRGLSPTVEEIDAALDRVQLAVRVTRTGIVFAAHGSVAEVISGNCPGVDWAGEAWAKAHGIPFRKFIADWNKHGKAAGPIRNRQMAEVADAGIGWWDGTSSGTANMVCNLVALGKPVRVVRIEGAK
jgi:hypothetical protein